jgi:hypothetical protein
MKAATYAARRLRESNPVADDAFAAAAGDSLGRATFEHITGSSAKPAPVRSLGRRRLFWLAAAAAGVAVVASLLPVLLSGPPRLARPVHTAWEPARPLPRGAVIGAGGPGGTWRLASYLVSAGWQENTAGPEPGYLTCPTAMTCYVLGDNTASPSGPADMDSLYVSYDGAVRWYVLPLPAGIAFTSALSCGSAASCAAGALDHGQPVFVTTRDGGHSWTIDPLPAGDGQIFQMSCRAATTCAGLVTAMSSLPLGQQYYVGVKFLAITDGGRHFATSAFPAGESMQDVSCPTTSNCVAIGVRNADSATSGVTMTEGLVVTTSDAGAHWRPGALPAGLGLGPSPQVTCVDVGHCFMLGYVHRQNPYGAVAVTADGGRTWTERPLPASVPDPQLSQIACPTDATCYVSGEQAVPQYFANGSSNGGSAMVLITHDAGLSWSRVAFATPARVPSGMRIDAFMAVGDIQCPQLNACIALGASDQGSKSTPVYTSTSTP